MFVSKSKPKISQSNDETVSINPISVSVPKILSLSQAKQVHAQIVLFGLTAHGKPISLILSSLSLSFSKSQHTSLRLLRYCLSLYNSFELRPSVFVTNNLIRCFAKSPFPGESVSLYSSFLRGFDKRPNRFTFTFVLQGCSNALGSEEGLQIHSHVVKFGFRFDVFARNALIKFYSSCFSPDGSWRVFEESVESRDVVTWNTILAVFVRDGRVEFAEKLFDEMPERDVVSWSTVIVGYVQSGFLARALRRFEEFRGEGLRPNEAMLVSVFSATAQLGLLGLGKVVHALVYSWRFPMSVFLGTSLIDMYAKCGSIGRAKWMFDAIHKKDVWAWNVMICGLASHGLGRETLLLFEKFVEEGFHPVNVTFVGVLSGCSKSGLVREGRHYFKAMVEVYDIEPEMEHYGCMVDLLGRAGLVDEAAEMVENMEISPDPVLWATLLGACRIHGNVELGEKIGNKLIELEPSHAGHYVQLSSVYAKARKWNQVVRIRRLMVERKARKAVGWSFLEAQGRVHKFVAGYKNHERFSEIRIMLNEIARRVSGFGYTPNVSPVLHDIGEEEKEVAIGEHSERIAIAFGMLVSGPGDCIRVVKNLRVCEDCHEVSKIISKVFNREIVVRDGSRFHHFKNGVCSCNDFW